MRGMLKWLGYGLLGLLALIGVGSAFGGGSRSSSTGRPVGATVVATQPPPNIEGTVQARVRATMAALAKPTALAQAVSAPPPTVPVPEATTAAGPVVAKPTEPPMLRLSRGYPPSVMECTELARIYHPAPIVAGHLVIATGNAWLTSPADSRASWQTETKQPRPWSQSWSQTLVSAPVAAARGHRICRLSPVVRQRRSAMGRISWEPTSHPAPGGRLASRAATGRG